MCHFSSNFTVTPLNSPLPKSTSNATYGSTSLKRYTSGKAKLDVNDDESIKAFHADTDGLLAKIEELAKRKSVSEQVRLGVANLMEQLYTERENFKTLIAVR